MVGIPAGTFVMGSPRTESGRFNSEGPQHSVAIKAFALGRYDVTSKEFLTFLRETGYQPAACNPILDMKWHSPGGGRAYSPYYGEPLRWPAVCLDWRDAERYIAWLNEKVRLAHPDPDRATGPYRLPTEAEWEYAARAGTKTARWWGNDIGVGKANCNGCGSKWDNRLLTDVDAFSPNPFGLYGMLGNAWQWTADCWHPNSRTPRRTAVCGAKKSAPTTSFGAGPGTICRSSYARPRAAGVGPEAGSTTIPVSRDFASPGIFREASPCDYRNASLGFRYKTISITLGNGRAAMRAETTRAPRCGR